MDPITKWCIQIYAYLTAFILYIYTFRKHLSEANKGLHDAVNQIEHAANITKDLVQDPSFQDNLRDMTQTVQTKLQTYKTEIFPEKEKTT